MKTSINETAAKIVKEIMDSPDRLDCTVQKINGATVIDAGVNVRGSEKLGQMVAEIAMGGLGVVRCSEALFGELILPIAIVATDRAKQAIMCSQFGGWRIEVGNFMAIAAGPATSLAQKGELRLEMNCEDISTLGVILLEGRQIPTPEVVEYLAEGCGITTSDLFCIVTPPASRVGSVLIASRIIQSGVFKLHKLGFHPDKVRSAYGVAPIAPVANNDEQAIGVSNACIMHGGRVFLYVRPGENDDLYHITNEIPYSFEHHKAQTDELGTQFGISHQYLDSHWFGPSEAILTDIETHESYSSGSVNSAALKEVLSSY